MKSTRIPDLHYSGVYQPDRRIDFNGFLWVRPEGNLLIDPMPLDESEARFVTEQGGAKWILLTNADHLRDALPLAEQYSAQVIAPAPDRSRFGDAAARIGTWFEGRDDLPAGLREVVDVRWLRGGKSEVEAAFILEPLRALVCGDLVRSHESGSLRLLPPPKLSDPATAAADVIALGADFDAVLLGDGDPLFRDASAALRELHTSLA